MKAHHRYRHKRATPVIRCPQAVWHPLPQCPGCRYERCVYEGEASALNWQDQDDDAAFYAEEDLVAEFIERVVLPLHSQQLA